MNDSGVCALLSGDRGNPILRLTQADQVLRRADGTTPIFRALDRSRGWREDGTSRDKDPDRLRHSRREAPNRMLVDKGDAVGVAGSKLFKVMVAERQFERSGRDEEAKDKAAIRQGDG